MQDEVILLGGAVAAVLISLVAATALRRFFPYFNFLEWFGTVFLLLGWYTLMISSAIDIVIPGKWVNSVQLAGFIAALVVPPFILYGVIKMRRKKCRPLHKEDAPQT